MSDGRKSILFTSHYSLNGGLMLLGFTAEGKDQLVRKEEKSTPKHHIVVLLQVRPAFFVPTIMEEMIKIFMFKNKASNLYFVFECKSRREETKLWINILHSVPTMYLPKLKAFFLLTSTAASTILKQIDWWWFTITILCHNTVSSTYRYVSM